MVTFSPHIDQRNEEPHSIIIWGIRTGQKKRAFHADKPPVWPIFKWSHDDKYFGRITDELLSVYETPVSVNVCCLMAITFLVVIFCIIIFLLLQSFGLLDKKSIKVPGIKDFSWSPTDNIIAYWIAEDKDVPAKVTLLSIPNREEVSFIIIITYIS